MADFKIVCLTISSFLVLSAHAVSAQNQTVESAQLEDRFETTPDPLSGVGPSIPEMDQVEAPSNADQIRFFLRGVRLSGNTAFDVADLEALYSDRVGQQISAADAFAMANAITAFYGQNGYPLSRAYIPAQEVDANGRAVLRINIIEGFIDRVEFQGEVNDRRGILQAYVEKIKAERPITTSTLERYTLLMRDLAGLQAETVLKQSEDQTGASTLIIKTEQDPFSGNFTLDNRGTEAVGDIQGNVNLRFNNLFGYFGRYELSYANANASDELHYLSTRIAYPIGQQGTELEFFGKFSRSQPGTQPLRDIELKSESETLGFKISHPFIRSRQTNLRAHVTLEGLNSKSENISGIATDDSIRSLRAGLNYDFSDSHGGITQIIGELSQGISGLGANSNDDPNNSRAEGRVDYTKLSFDLSYRPNLAAWFPEAQRFRAQLSMMGQYTNDPLLSSEECGVGGSAYGSAYDSSEILGDRCLAGKIEVMYNAANSGPLTYLQPYANYAAGQVWNLDSTASPSSESLASAALGVRFGLLDNLDGSLEIAKPLTRTPSNEGDNDARIFFSLSARF